LIPLEGSYRGETSYVPVIFIHQSDVDGIVSNLFFRIRKIPKKSPHRYFTA
jgi:hypothetical protein